VAPPQQPFLVSPNNIAALSKIKFKKKAIPLLLLLSLLHQQQHLFHVFSFFLLSLLLTGSASVSKSKDLGEKAKETRIALSQNYFFFCRLLTLLDSTVIVVVLDYGMQ
jgi:hypothetical protein